MNIRYLTFTDHKLFLHVVLVLLSNQTKVSIINIAIFYFLWK